jgi:hypothetical protein
MNLERYDYKNSKSFLNYEFYSEGPKGVIKKVIRFMPATVGSYSYYNLAFGDWNESENTIADFIVSNNHDAEKVLATIASAVLDFTDRYPNVMIYAEGSTASRTRLYQMALNKYWNEIDTVIEIYGLIEGEGFQLFERGRNYGAFVVKRKN